MYLSETDPSMLTEEEIDRLLFLPEAEQLHESDYAILLGTAPKYAPERAKIAAGYYFGGGTKRVIATGAAVSDPTVTEAEVMRRALLALGVPADAVIDEPHATTTVGNMICSLSVMNELGDVTKIKRITVITEPFHIRRSVALAKVLLPGYVEVYGYTAYTAAQREAWRTDDRLNQCVRNEISVLTGLVRDGVIPDISF